MTAETGTLARNIGSTFKKVSGWYIAFGVVGALGGSPPSPDLSLRGSL